MVEEKLRLFWEFYEANCNKPMSMEDFTRLAFLAGYHAAQQLRAADGAKYCQCDVFVADYLRCKNCGLLEAPRR